MAAGDLALVLHAHLPYVRSGEPGSLEEDWYFQALQECYLPLLEVLEAAAADPAQRPRLTLGLSPTLLSLLSDAGLNRRFQPWLEQRLVLLEEAPAELAAPADDLRQRLRATEEQFLACEGDLLPRFRQLRRAGVLDLITCGATHGYLPLLRDTPEAVRAQLLTATPCSTATACCMPCPAPAMASTRRSARRRGWASSPATANPPCRSGAPARATPAMAPIGSSTAISAGICPRNGSRRPASAAAGPWG